MKKIVPFLAGIAIVALAFQCEKPEPVDPVVTNPVAGVLDMNFKAMYANKPLVINRVYDYNGKKIMFEKLQFFIAYDPSSFDAAVGTSLPKTALLKFSALQDDASAAAGVSFELPLANKTWTSANFGIGIPKNLNAQLPKDFSFPDGMADSGNFWDSWQSYIFTKLEGKIDKDGDGVFETGITLHTGGDDVFTPMKFVKSFDIKDNTTTKLNFELGIEALVKNIDLTTVNSTHQSGASPTMKVMMGNFPTALTIK
ncbi:MAG: MbnP family protein [Saprospiraceae bacterium]|nr:MbnP family protein [Saprospiraceae bacterium]